MLRILQTGEQSHFLLEQHPWNIACHKVWGGGYSSRVSNIMIERRFFFHFFHPGKWCDLYSFRKSYFLTFKWSKSSHIQTCIRKEDFNRSSALLFRLSRGLLQWWSGFWATEDFKTVLSDFLLCHLQVRMEESLIWAIRDPHFGGPFNPKWSTFAVSTAVLLW